ncbi:MAG: DUF1538 domain-containing protein [Gemmatimonadetes bacterium]|nr:DUF1538 domain-containing protein [Gemmatimonadota bacterium]NNF13185.1 DUF1538 domain-containing protein [Gemmatimonadota bacterium]
MALRTHTTAAWSVVTGITRRLGSALADLVPIIVVVAFFQVVVLRQPFPQLGEILLGGVLVVLGLMLFVEGLEIGLFPIGEAMADALAQKGSLFWLIAFSFALGFSTTVAEPALIAVSDEAARIAADGDLIENSDGSRASYALGLRLSVAFSVGLAIVVGVLRILKGWPLYYLIIGGYVMVMLMTIVAPREIIGLAYDAGGVTTSTITVPLVTALGVGLSSVIKGRSPLTDGFGLIAFASLLPMVFVMGYGLLVF